MGIGKIVVPEGSYDKLEKRIRDAVVPCRTLEQALRVALDISDEESSGMFMKKKQKRTPSSSRKSEKYRKEASLNLPVDAIDGDEDYRR